MIPLLERFTNIHKGIFAKLDPYQRVITRKYLVSYSRLLYSTYRLIAGGSLKSWTYSTLKRLADFSLKKMRKVKGFDFGRVINRRSAL